jgi:poly(hydroxyalkanoate) depolymerase family esterase
LSALRAVAVLAVVLCATAAHGAEDRVVRGVHDGRSYRLFLPAAPVAGRPLILALHGCAQTPDDFARGTRLDRAAARRGLRVLYPAQGPFANPARCWNWFATPSAASGEVADLLALVREVQRTLEPEAQHLVVIGFSAGGYMAVNLTCAAPALVVGVGVAAGGPYRCADSRGAIACMRGERLDGRVAAARCASARGTPSVRASLWHGDGDSVVSPANLAALTEMFVALRDLRPPSMTERREGAGRTVYRQPDGRAVIESWLVPGMGHAWSGGDPRGTHTYPPGPDATEHMLRFLVDD